MITVKGIDLDKELKIVEALHRKQLAITIQQNQLGFSLTPSQLAKIFDQVKTSKPKKKIDFFLGPECGLYSFKATTYEKLIVVSDGRQVQMYAQFEKTDDSFYAPLKESKVLYCSYVWKDHYLKGRRLSDGKDPAQEIYRQVLKTHSIVTDHTQFKSGYQMWLKMISVFLQESSHKCYVFYPKSSSKEAYTKQITTKNKLEKTSSGATWWISDTYDHPENLFFVRR